jgi:hypothetical protein
MYAVVRKVFCYSHNSELDLVAKVSSFNTCHTFSFIMLAINSNKGIEVLYY